MNKLFISYEFLIWHHIKYFLFYHRVSHSIALYRNILLDSTEPNSHNLLSSHSFNFLLTCLIHYIDWINLIYLSYLYVNIQELINSTIPFLNILISSYHLQYFLYFSRSDLLSCLCMQLCLILLKLSLTLSIFLLKFYLLIVLTT